MGDLDRLLGVLTEARYRLVRIALVLAPLFGFLLFFELVPFALPIPFLGVTVPFAYPWPNPFYNVTAQVFLAMVA
ncbi:MAG TPA: hypothetical protein VEG42_04970, partial [Thermoplasmata archaeon]|nr:hypothetical protein [Thermoplasmata archaeon]